MENPPPAGCWNCGTLPTSEDTDLRAVLHPRSAEEGGPVTLLVCRGCGEEGALESVPGVGPVIGPGEAVGMGAPLAKRILAGAGGARRAARAARWIAGHGSAFAAARERRFRRGEGDPTGGARDRGADEPRADPGAGGGAGPAAASRPGSAPPPPTSSMPGSPPPPRADAREDPLTPEGALALLDLTPGASRDAIEAAWRAASRRCHPDLVAHLDPDFRRLAHEKMLRLNAARDLLLGRTPARRRR